MAGKAPRQTMVWPATGRRMEVAAVDVARFVADGWLAAGGVVAADAAVVVGEGSPPAKRKRAKPSE